MSKGAIEKLFGGSKIIGHTIETEMDLYELGKYGIPKKALLILSKKIDLSLKVLSRLLHITERTLQRKGELDLLNENISEHVIQIAEVYSRGEEIFNSLQVFQEWATSVNTSLGNREPIELLTSRYGAQMVLDELGRIEYGVYS